MRKSCTRFAIAAGVLAAIWAGSPTASAEATVWQMPSIKNTTLQTAFGRLSGLMGAQEHLMLLQPGTAPPKKVPPHTLYVRPVLLKGDLQPVYNMTDWVVCHQSPAADGKLTPKSKITVQIVRPRQGCK